MISQKQGAPTERVQSDTLNTQLQLCLENYSVIINKFKETASMTTAKSAKARELLANAYNIEMKRTELYERLLKISDGIAEKKIESNDMKEFYQTLSGRLTRITKSIAHLSKTFNNGEKYEKDFENFDGCIDVFRNDLHDIQMQSEAVRKLFTGSATPFCASVFAQKFMMSKLDNDVERLRDLVMYLDLQLQSLEYNEKNGETKENTGQN